ncbi:hypothetical protein BC939DRAFT_501293 [Gamsiella multidivaricata]|uniref:uncharacterized protein n=1 Tax=Gamsiella multidivaricata TaxID=101098 RepID=UPI0022200913|nr:uncharacterized protein BC939DRAFT_501293 [Gamsiella multidivaricata]KAG0370345.1 hypothetical protein BGZ54_006812 [Gamsiella multidivaricata]KAI7827450.1 hypothetical protein BC939DRAFT_501293 [Gamsiella multidivaricata]
MNDRENLFRNHGADTIASLLPTRSFPTFAVTAIPSIPQPSPHEPFDFATAQIPSLDHAQVFCEQPQQSINELRFEILQQRVPQNQGQYSPPLSARVSVSQYHCQSQSLHRPHSPDDLPSPSRLHSQPRNVHQDEACVQPSLPELLMLETATSNVLLALTKECSVASDHQEPQVNQRVCQRQCQRRRHLRRRSRSPPDTPPVTSPLIDAVVSMQPDKRLNRRRRLSIDETEYLMHQFYKNEKPSTKERLAFAQYLSLDPRTVQVWFQNRRAKLKRDELLARVIYGEQEEVEEEEYRGNEEAGDEQLARSSDSDDNDDSCDTHEDQRVICSPANSPTASNTSLAAMVQQRNSNMAHRGSGAETFVGFERSDAGLDVLLNSDFGLPVADRAVEDDMSVALVLGGDYCDMATLGFELTYEQVLSTIGGSRVPLDIPLMARGHADDNSDLSSAPSSNDSSEASNPKDTNKLRVKHKAPRQQPARKASSYVSGSQSQSHQHPKCSGHAVGGSSSSSSKTPAMRMAPYFLQHQNPIPRQQLALTLISAQLTSPRT